MKKLVEEHPLLSKLPSWLKKGLAVEPGEWADLPVNRRRRRKRMRRDGFIAHIYAGAEEGFTLQKAWEQIGGGEDSLLEVGIKRGENHDMPGDQGVYSGLIRAALEGKIKAVVAAPNCRTNGKVRNLASTTSHLKSKRC